MSISIEENLRNQLASVKRANRRMMKENDELKKAVKGFVDDFYASFYCGMPDHSHYYKIFEPLVYKKGERHG